MTNKQKEIIDNNSLIAEFMDLEYVSPSLSNGDYGWWKKGKFKEGRSFNNPNFIAIHSFNLKYHSDWNKLMPVIEKCYSSKDNDKMSSLTEKFDFWNKDFMYAAVVEYIKWYNQNK